MACTLSALCKRSLQACTRDLKVTQRLKSLEAPLHSELLWGLDSYNPQKLPRLIGLGLRIQSPKQGLFPNPSLPRSFAKFLRTSQRFFLEPQPLALSVHLITVLENWCLGFSACWQIRAPTPQTFFPFLRKGLGPCFCFPVPSVYILDSVCLILCRSEI